MQVRRKNIERMADIVPGSEEQSLQHFIFRALVTLATGICKPTTESQWQKSRCVMLKKAR